MKPDKYARFARQLASNKSATRRRSVTVLRKWLASRGARAQVGEFAKLWKGLFYCMWMSDKVPVQMHLASNLARLSDGMERATFFKWYAVYLATMHREWAGIDNHRLNKFYSLARKCLATQLGWLKASGWDMENCVMYVQLFIEMVFQADEPSSLTEDVRRECNAVGPVPFSFAYHMCDVYLEELVRVSSNELPDDIAITLLQPFVRTMAAHPSKRLRARVKEAVFDRLVQGVLVEDESGAVNEHSGTQQRALYFGTSPAVFAELLLDVASDRDTRDSNRAVLYALKRQFAQLAKLMGEGVKEDEDESSSEEEEDEQEEEEENGGQEEGESESEEGSDEGFGEGAVRRITPEHLGPAHDEEMSDDDEDEEESDVESDEEAAMAAEAGDGWETVSSDEEADAASEDESNDESEDKSEDESGEESPRASSPRKAGRREKKGRLVFALNRNKVRRIGRLSPSTPSSKRTPTHGILKPTPPPRITPRSRIKENTRINGMVGNGFVEATGSSRRSPYSTRQSARQKESNRQRRKRSGGRGGGKNSGGKRKRARDFWG